MTVESIEQLIKRVNDTGVKGFLADDEAAELYDRASTAARLAPCLEVGSYCGKSAIFLAAGCRNAGSVLYSVDHHRGSEEHQKGEEYHDPDLFNADAGVVDTLPEFRATIERFEVEDSVIPIVAPSQRVVQNWVAPLGMVFIDGGHSHEQALADCMAWSRHIVPGGVLAIHDIFPNPEDGGQGPYLALQAVLETGRFQWQATVSSLGILRCSARYRSLPRHRRAG